MTQPARPRESTMKIKVLKSANVKKTLSGCPFVIDDPPMSKK